MSTENLDIYKDAHKLVHMILENIQNMPGKYRKVLGDRMLDAACESLELVHRANGAQGKEERIAVLGSLITTMNILNTYLRISNERQYINVTQSALMFQKSNSVIRQAAGWRKSIKV